jgi:hypothetical protein
VYLPTQDDSSDSPEPGRAALPAWKVPRGVDLALVGRAALAEIEPPDLRVAVVARGEALVVEVLEGVAPHGDEELMLVDHHGPYEVLRRDVDVGGAAPRVRLTLAPWPRR